MGNVILFKPRSELDAEKNLQDFIAFSKNKLTTFGSKLDFEQDSWDVTQNANLRARSCKMSLRFSAFPSGRGQRDGEAMPEPFKSFVKAYLRYVHSLNSNKVNSHELSALRGVLQAILELSNNVNPVFLEPRHFQLASQILTKKYSADSCANANSELEKLSEFLVENHLTATKIIWRKPASSKKNYYQTRVGPEFEAQRTAKLPSSAALTAIAEIFRCAKDPSDVFVTSACAIMASSPNRINELLHLKVNCEVTTKNSNGNPVYGLRWRPSKGGEAVIKWTIESMANVAQEAVANLRKLSEDARKVALWYELNPTKIYLPNNLEYLRSKPRLNNREICEIIFRDPPNKLKPEQVGAKWCSTQKISSKWEGGSPSQGGCNTVAFEDVEKAVIRLLPKGFPFANSETGLKYSECLCLTLRNELSSSLSVYRCAITLADPGVLRTRLVGTKSVKTIFEKFGYRDESGLPLRLNTHQFRHYLNTLAQIGGVDQLDIAKWSGRANVAQNAVYDHQSDRDVLALVKSAIGEDNKIFGSLANVPKSALITRDQFAALKILTAHTTDFGYCIHDFSMLPCQTHRDCLNCDEQVCIKGEMAHEKAIKIHKKETEVLLLQAKEAMTNEEFGANKWVEHQTKTLERLDQLCRILDNPDVPKGAVIHPAGIVASGQLIGAANHRLSRDISVPEIKNLTTSFTKKED